MNDETKAFRKSLADTIGDENFTYVSAADPAKHFDTWLALHHYAGELFLLFMTGAARGLWRQIKDKSKEMVKDVGEEAWKKVAASISELEGVDAASGEKEQLHEIERSKGAAASLAKALAGSYVEDFLSGGKAVLLKKLRKDNFPADKAERIAAQFTREVKKRIA
jgi:hypothetical protein